MYSIEIHKQALKFLKSLETNNRNRIYEKIEKLRENPYPKEVIRVRGYEEKVFRVRVGRYRMLYYIDHTTLTIFIIKIDKRAKVY